MTNAKRDLLLSTSPAQFMPSRLSARQTWTERQEDFNLHFISILKDASQHSLYVNRDKGFVLTLAVVGQEETVIKYFMAFYKTWLSPNYYPPVFIATPATDPSLFTVLTIRLASRIGIDGKERDDYLRQEMIRDESSSIEAVKSPKLWQRLFKRK